MPMWKLFKVIAARHRVSVKSLRFLIDGELIKDWETATGLKLEENDQIDYMHEQLGD